MFLFDSGPETMHSWLRGPSEYAVAGYTMFMQRFVNLLWPEF